MNEKIRKKVINFQSEKNKTLTIHLSPLTKNEISSIFK